jgi:hypothetical protein
MQVFSEMHPTPLDSHDSMPIFPKLGQGRKPIRRESQKNRGSCVTAAEWHRPENVAQGFHFPKAENLEIKSTKGERYHED